MDQSLPSVDIYPWGQEEISHLLVDLPHNATMAAQHGVHKQSQAWYPQVNEHTLLGRAVSERRTIIITDTSTTPGTGSRTTIAALTVAVALYAGNNTIAFSNPSTSAPDIDRIVV